MAISSARFDRVKLGVVGLGSFGRLHVETISTLAESELVAVVDQDRQRLEEVARISPGIDQWNDIQTAIWHLKQTISLAD